MYNVTLPALGENIDKAAVSFWFFKAGDSVKEKDDLVEMTTDKAAFNVPCPCTGQIAEIFFSEGDTVRVGETLCTIQEA